MIEQRKYRYVSPVLFFDPATDEILQIVSAALTNRPNLEMAALNQRRGDQEEEAARGILRSQRGLLR